MPKTLFLSLILLFALFNVTPAFADPEPSRTVNDYLTLWGTETGIIGQDQLAAFKARIKSAASNGVVYLGPTADGGYDSQGNLKKIITIISLTIDPAKERGWNMVGARFDASIDTTSAKYYLRLLDQSFIVRTYQKDASGQVINESLSEVPVCTFLSCWKNSSDTVGSSTRIEWAKQGKPSDRIVKFRADAAALSNIGNSYEDGYTTSPQGGAQPTVTGGATACAAGAAAGAVLPVGITSIAGCVIGAAAYLLVDTSGPVLVMRQVANIIIPINSNLEKGQPTYMDLWYLGSARKTTTDKSFEPAPFEANNERIKFFTNLHIEGGYNSTKYPFYQIGPTIQFTTPATLTDAQTSATDAVNDVATNSQLGTNDSSFLPSCNILNGMLGGSDGTFLGCIAQLFYYAIYSPIQWFAGVMGQVFDFFLGFSLDDQSYRADFVVTAWKIIRDISNIFFIIILVYTGFAAVFDIKGVSMKHVIPNLIINALLINFSLFATRVAIDASNIFARIFYNRINVCKGACEQNENGTITNQADTIYGYKQVSVHIVSTFDPQTIFSPKTLSLSSLPTAYKSGNLQENLSDLPVSGQNDEQMKQLRPTNRYAAYFILVSAVAAAIVLGMALMFWKVSFFFLGRVIGLYITMIFAPFAFLTRENMPLVSKLKQLRWDDWLGELTNYTLLAPIFVFFLYIIYGIATSPFLTHIQETIRGDGDIIPTVLSVTIPLLIIYFFIDYGVSIAKSYAGFVGGKVQANASKAIGYTVGAGVVAAGATTAFAGTTLGAGAGKLLGKTKLGAWASQNAGTNRFARRISNALDWTQTSTWDPRRTRIGELAKKNRLFDAMDLKTAGGQAAAVGIGLNESRFEGGAVGIAKRRKESKDMKERITGFNYLSDEQAKKMWQQEQDKLIGEEAMRNYLNKTDGDFKDQSEKIKKEEKNVKDLTEQVNTLKSDIRTNNKLSESEKKAQEKLLETKEEELKNSKNTISSLKSTQRQTIKSIRDDKKQKDAIQAKSDYKTAYEEAKKASDGKFGRIENTKDYANAMRRVYVEELQNNSFWMKDGKPRQWIPAVGTSGMLASLLTKFGTGVNLAVGGVASALLADNIMREREAIDAATKSFLKDYDKSKKSSDKVWQYKDKLKKMDQLLKEELAIASTGKARADLTKEDIENIKLDELDIKEQEKEIEKRIDELRAEMDLQNEEYKKVAESYRKGGPGSKTAADLKAASKAKKAADDRYDALRNIWKNKRDAEDGIDKETSK